MTDQPPAHAVRAQPRAPSPIVDFALDAATVVGAGLIDYGVALVSRPAAFIVAGAILMVGAWLFARRSAA